MNSTLFWFVFVSAALVCVFALTSKAIKPSLKLAIIFVMLLYAVYFLVQAGILFVR